jgi:hypothetical protein
MGVRGTLSFKLSLKAKKQTGIIPDTSVQHRSRYGTIPYQERCRHDLYEITAF